jgi:UDP-N-acetylglucosamine 2-epimerase
MAPVIKELRQRRDSFQTSVCSTGQHRQMLDQSLGFFGIKPDFELNLMTHNQTLSGLTSLLFAALDPVIQQVKPDWILAQGDTTTVLVAGLIAYYHHIYFGHVEAGLRTQNKYHPFPEEMNRRLADQTADLLFAPTETARTTLLTEGFPESKVIVTGNTVVDALHAISQTPYDWDGGPLQVLDRNRPWVLITSHRRESFGAPFRNICEAIKELALRFGPDGIQFLYPVHLNPNVRGPVAEILNDIPMLFLTEPLDYRSFVAAMAGARLILTDSGGVQEEAPSFGVPVLVMRETTERPEGVEAGVSRLVGTTRERIVSEASLLLGDATRREEMTCGTNPYGDGRAAQRIVDHLYACP